MSQHLAQAHSSTLRGSRQQSFSNRTVDASCTVAYVKPMFTQKQANVGRQHPSSGPQGQIQASGNSGVGSVTTKLFADKENNCDATHYMNVKKPAQSLKYSNTSENPLNSKLEAPEHQMTDESEVDGSFNGPSNFSENNPMVNTSEQCDLGLNTLQSSAHVSASPMIEQSVFFSQFNLSHPSFHLSRETTNDIDRQNINVNSCYGDSIMDYCREFELGQLTENSLLKHKISPALRARMIDWMIEVLTNFKCDNQTFFLSASLMDRYFKNRKETLEVTDLHIIGVTCMFMASKYEDIYPLKMKMVHEKISHSKIPIAAIKSLEQEILKHIHYKIPAPNVIDFLRVYLKDVLDIGHFGNTSLTPEEKENLPTTSDSPEGMKHLIHKMAMYLAKMAIHDYELSGKRPSLVAIGVLYVSLKICEQLKRQDLITNSILSCLVKVAKAEEEDIVQVSQKVLYLAQNWDRTFQGLENLKKTHFVIITKLL